MHPELPRRIETGRLLLRRHELTDVDDVFAFAVDADWARYLPVPQPYERRHAEEFIARQVLLDWTASPSWAMVFEGSVVGGINLRLEHDHGVGEMGYSIARLLWGRGLVAEGARAVLDAAFTTLPPLRRVRAFADARNTASQRVMIKLGMSAEGVLRQNRLTRGEVIDEAWYGVLREELSDGG